MTLSTVGRRGILLSLVAILMSPPDVHAAAGDGQQAPPPPALTLRYQYVGFLGEDHGAGSCKAARRNGTITVDVPLAHDGGEPPDQVAYRGRGRVSMDIDHCDLKPVSGGVHDYCTISIASRFDADIAFELGEMQDGATSEADLEVDPVRPFTATADGDCEASAIAQVRRELQAGTYWTGQHIAAVAEDAVLQSLAKGGIPQVGTHAGAVTSSGRWTITLSHDAGCENERIAREHARAEAARAAEDVHRSFMEARALSNGLASVPATAPVATFMQSQEGALITAFAARTAAPAGTARDAAEATYGAAVARVAAQATTQIAQLAVANVPSPSGGPADPRIAQLSLLLQRFGAQAQTLASGLQLLKDSVQRYDACVAKGSAARRP